LLALFGGRPNPVMARLVESGSLTLEDIKEAEDAKEAPEEGWVAMTIGGDARPCRSSRHR
jgi:hypothetical protein